MNVISLYAFCLLSFVFNANRATPGFAQASTELPSTPNTDMQYKQELKQLIEQIRSIRIKAQRGSTAAVAESKPESSAISMKSELKIQPNKTKDTNLPGAQLRGPNTQISGLESRQDWQKVTGVELPYKPISEQTLQIVEQLSRQIESGKEGQRIESRMLTESGFAPDLIGGQGFAQADLADILFLCGHPEQAAVFYRQALEHITTGDGKLARDGDWILFQLANCLRVNDPAAARNMYRKLITDYPDSPWIVPAKTWEQLLDWYQKDEPLTLIEQLRSPAKGETEVHPLEMPENVESDQN